jgi:dipeptidyl aminopeptidase/acylaminoacyl peptidase
MMNEARRIGRYGQWESPIALDDVVKGSLRLSAPRWLGDAPCWLEGRAEEAGRVVLAARGADGLVHDLVPAPFSVRTMVHEYGGGAHVIDGSDVWFVNAADQAIYHVNVDLATLAPRGAPHRVAGGDLLRFADFTVDRERNRLICVVEDHGNDDEPENYIGAVELGDGSVHALVRGDDFYSNPRICQRTDRLCWVSWRHPNMPWDATRLCVAELQSDGSLGPPLVVLDDGQSSIYQPSWRISESGSKLYFVADPEGWWNIFAWDGGNVEPVVTMAREFAHPQWVFGTSTYGFLDDGRLLVSSCADGVWQLGLVAVEGGELQALQSGLGSVGDLEVQDARALVLGGAPESSGGVWQVALADGSTEGIASVERVRASSSIAMSTHDISSPRTIEFATSEGQTAHALFYPPANARWQGPVDERPPLIVIGHGGPTGATSATLSVAIQFWTTRGFAVLDVDYRGSTGYGRAYRDALKGQWGIYDVVDCVNGANHLAAEGWVDGERMAIRGGSAGGYTALAAIAFYDVFKAGASYYGISELESLATDTHKFESRYLDQLIGPYPEQRARRTRSCRRARPR